MLRHWIFQLAFFPVLLPVLVGCSGASGEPSQDVQSDNTDAADIVDCPDGLVFWEEYGVCVPGIPECEYPWEMPTVDGECVVVGPRACPNTWDPDADVDCESGDLLPCKEGFVLTEDEVACVPHFDDDCDENEIPVLGGGCQKIGPEWGVEGEPYFDECGEGLLALPGGGCVLVGPRACPKLWDPDADGDCETGDVLPCPDGWIEGEDGLYCAPVYDDCGLGEQPLLGGGCHRVIPLPEDCPPGPFPEVPEGTTDVVYVLAGSPCTEGCGSEAAPYPWIQAAIDAAPVGGSVLVGAGVYTEGLSITKSLNIIGVCAGQVEIAGSALVPGGESKVFEAAVALVGADGVSLWNLRLAPAAAGIAVVESTGVALRSIEVSGSGGPAVYIDTQSEVNMEDIWIHGAGAGYGQLAAGYGVWAGGGSSVDAANLLLEDAQAAGLQAIGPGTVLGLAASTVRGTGCTTSGSGGFGIRGVDGSQISAEEVLVEGNRTAGLSLTQGCGFDLESIVVRGMLPDCDDQFGFGIDVESGAHGALGGSTISGAVRLGLMVNGVGTNLHVERTVVLDTEPGPTFPSGKAFEVGAGAEVVISGAVFARFASLAGQVHGAGTEVSVLGSAILQPHLPPGTPGGAGVISFEGALLTMRRCTITGVREFGVVAMGDGVEVELDVLSLQRVTPDATGKGGYGIGAFDGASLVAHAALLGNCEGTGARGAGAGAHLVLEDSAIRSGMVDAPGANAFGVEVSEGAWGEMERLVVDGVPGIGIIVRQSGSALSVVDSVIRKTRPAFSGLLGYGLHVQEGGQAELDGVVLSDNASAGFGMTEGQASLAHCLVSNNGTSGAFADGVASTLELHRSIIRLGMDAEPEARGLQIGGSAECVVTSCLLEVWGTAAVVVDLAGSLLLDSSHVVPAKLTGAGDELVGLLLRNGSAAGISHSLISGPLKYGVALDGEGTMGSIDASVISGVDYGAQVGESAQLLTEDTLVRGSPVAGLAAFGEGTEIVLRRAVIQRAPTDAPGTPGYGAYADLGASLSADRCLFDGNSVTGIVAMSPDTTVQVLGSILRTAGVGTGGGAGTGATALEGGTAALGWSHVRGNTTVGVLAHGSGSVLNLDRVTIAGTLPGFEVVDIDGEVRQVTLGDGVLVWEADAQIRASMTHANARTGVYFKDASGVVSDCLVFGNESYGIALSESEVVMETGAAGNYVFGNAGSLSGVRREQISTSPGSLPVPSVHGFLSLD